MGFTLGVETAADYLVARGLAPSARGLVAEELTGGVSASVVAVRGNGVGVVVKQALHRLRVSDEWRAKQERTETEAEAMRLCASLTPGAVPAVLDADPEAHVIVIELLPPAARNWQDEIAAGRIHEACGSWAGATLGTWHARTAGRGVVAATFDDFEAFEQLRLRPFYETVMRRLPEAAEPVAACLAELRSTRKCLVHGDYAKKNMLVGPGRQWVLDFEVAHVGDPVFDLGFFLSFVVLSTVRWPRHEAALAELGRGFLDGYASTAGGDLARDVERVTAHTACLVLARTDGTSPALFLDDASRRRARQRALRLLAAPGAGLWA